MPRVSLYGAPQVNQASAFDARYRAADAGDGGLASSVVQFGKQLGRYADEEAKTRADDLMLQADRRMKEAAIAFKQQAGKNALESRKDAMSTLDKARDEVLAGATDPLVRRYLEPVMEKYHGLYAGDMSSHAAAQEKEYTKATGSARASNFAENAVLAKDKPDVRADFIASYRGQIEANLRAEGLGDPEIISAQVRKGESSIHASIVDSYVADGDIDTANAYFEAHRDAMIAGDETSVSGRLLGPLQKREAAQDFARSTALPTLAPAKDQPTGKPAPVDDGRAVIAGLFPKAQITSNYRPSDHALSRANPKSWHTNSHAAIDVKPIKGMEFDQYVKTIEDAGYSIIEAKNEVGSGRSAHATGDHWHVVVGSGGGAQQAARRWDKESVYANIDATADAEDWTFERRERAKAYADGQISRDEQLLSRRENEADRQAQEIILGKGDTFTDTSAIPRAVWAGMSTSQRSSAMNLAKANAAPKEPEANGSAIIQAHAIMYSDEARFKALDLTQYVGKVTRGELDSLVSEQAKMRNPAKTGVDVSVRSSVSETINFHTKLDPALDKALDASAKGTDATKAAYANVARDMEANLRSITGGKRPATDAEKDAAFKRATMTVVAQRSGFFGPSETETPRYAVKPGEAYRVETVPDAVRSRIVASYQKRIGRAPSEAEVARLYVQQLGKAGFW